MAVRFAVLSESDLNKEKHCNGVITQLLKSQNIVIAKYRDLSVPHRSITINYFPQPSVSANN